MAGRSRVRGWHVVVLAGVILLASCGSSGQSGGGGGGEDGMSGTGFACTLTSAGFVYLAQQRLAEKSWQSAMASAAIGYFVGQGCTYAIKTWFERPTKPVDIRVKATDGSTASGTLSGTDFSAPQLTSSTIDPQIRQMCQERYLPTTVSYLLCLIGRG